VAAGGTDIGTRGMIVAAKTMALTAIDLYLHPEQIQKANEEFKKAKGTYEYKHSLVTVSGTQLQGLENLLLRTNKLR
jgi:hypothetical protein